MDEGRLLAVIEKQRRLLGLEEDAVVEEQHAFLSSLNKRKLQHRGVALYGLKINEQRTGLAGKLIVEYGNFNHPILPAHVIKVGDVVQLNRISNGQECSVSGIVCRVKEESISVAFKDDYPDGLCEGLRMLKLANRVVFDRMRQALKQLEMVEKTAAADVAQVVFGRQALFTRHVAPDVAKVADKFYNPRLNGPQKQAVINALNAQQLALIHGPPGTGKTETLVEIIKQSIKPRIFLDKAKKILVCGPSNLSIDNIVERLVSSLKQVHLDIVRIGHPARVLTSVLEHSLDYRIAFSDAGALVKDIRNDIDKQLKQLDKAGTRKGTVYTELKELRRELRQREKGSLEQLLSGSNPTLSTLSMAGGSLLRSRQYDLIIVDEAGQALEAETWIAILLGTKVIMAGDHCQLPPTVTSSAAESAGLGITLFERLIHQRPEAVSLLTIQHRMHETIMNWSSNAFYEGRLEASPCVAKHCLCDLEGVKVTEGTEAAMIFMDTTGFDLNESQDDEDQSKYNEGEAKLVVQHLRNLLAAGVNIRDVAIITPYNAQVSFIESLLTETDLKGLEIGSGKWLNE